MRRPAALLIRLSGEDELRGHRNGREVLEGQKSGWPRLIPGRNASLLAPSPFPIVRAVPFWGDALRADSGCSALFGDGRPNRLPHDRLQQAVLVPHVEHHDW
jgi:hypothetical protein